MADLWSEIGKGTNVWIIAREVYSSAAICISNRSATMRQVVVDASNCNNAVVLAADTDRITPSSCVVQRMVPAGETVVVLCLSPLVPGEGLAINVDARCSDGETFLATSPPAAGGGAAAPRDDNRMRLVGGAASTATTTSTSPVRAQQQQQGSESAATSSNAASTTAAFLSESEQQSRQVDDWLEHRKKAPSAAQQPTLLWQAQVGSAIRNSIYHDPSTHNLLINAATELAVLDSRSGLRLNSVPAEGSDGVSDVVPADDGSAAIYYTDGYTLHCRDARTLASRWTTTVQHRFRTSPLLVSSKSAIFAGSFFAHVFYRFDAASGQVVWNASFHGWGVYSRRATYSAKYNLVIFASDAAVIALDADTGSLAWQLASLDLHKTTGVLSSDEETVFFGTSGGALYAIFTATGGQKWKFPFPIGGIGTAPLVRSTSSGDVLYFASLIQSECFAVDGSTGKQLWRVTGQDNNCGRTNSNFPIAREYTDNSGTTFVLVPHNHWKLGVQGVALNGTGVAWSWLSAKNAIDGVGSADSEGRLFLGDKGGYVYALQLPGGRESGLIQETQCSNTQCAVGCTQRQYRSGVCVQESQQSSILRICQLFGSQLTVKIFSQSAFCNTSTPFTRNDYAVGKCYQGQMGNSFEITSCRA